MVVFMMVVEGAFVWYKMLYNPITIMCCRQVTGSCNIVGSADGPESEWLIDYRIKGEDYDDGEDVLNLLVLLQFLISSVIKTMYQTLYQVEASDSQTRLGY